jgi:hypothetical protein
MAMSGKVIGPGGTGGSAKYTDCKSIGPGGVASQNRTTTSRGYEGSRTQGLRSEYRESGRAENSKATK